MVLQLLVSVFAWQAVIQSIPADTCECTDAQLLASCMPARMDWQKAMLMISVLKRAEAESKAWVDF